jgi:hypothetical protein
MSGGLPLVGHFGAHRARGLLELGGAWAAVEGGSGAGLPEEDGSPIRELPRVNR